MTFDDFVGVLYPRSSEKMLLLCNSLKESSLVPDTTTKVTNLLHLSFEEIIKIPSLHWTTYQGFCQATRPLRDWHVLTQQDGRYYLDDGGFNATLDNLKKSWNRYLGK